VSLGNVPEVVINSGSRGRWAYSILPVKNTAIIPKIWDITMQQKSKGTTANHVLFKNRIALIWQMLESETVFTQNA